MKLEWKPSLVLAVIGWTSVFVEGWLIILRIVPADWLSWTFFAVYFIVATMASAVYGGKKKIQ